MSRLRSSGQPRKRNGVSGPDATSSEMRRFPRLGRLGSEPDELVLEMILESVSLPLDTPAELAALPVMMADLSGPAEPGELAGEAAVLARFRSRVGPAGSSGAARRSTRRKAFWRLAPHSPRLAAGLVVAAIGLGGTAAAYAGALPGPLQDLAHRVLDAPPAHHGSGHQSGVVPGHGPSVAHAVTPSRQQAPPSAARGSTAGHRTPGTRADSASSTHSATPRPTNEPSPRPTRHRRSRPPPPRRTPQQSRPRQPNRAR